LNGARQRNSGGGVGLSNTRARLGRFYDDDFEFEINGKKNQTGTIVRLDVPYYN
jgi:sensor histidine kinase YesM